MVRSMWTKSILAAMASAGLSLAAPGEQIITIKETQQQCKILSTINGPNGASGYLVQDLKTGEKFPLLQAKDGLKRVPSLPGMNENTSLVGKIITVNEEKTGQRKARITNAWTTPEGQQAYQAQFTDGTEMVTIVSTAANQAQPGGKISTRIYHWGQSKVSPPGAPVPEASTTTTSAKPVSTPSPGQSLQLPPTTTTTVQTSATTSTSLLPTQQPIPSLPNLTGLPQAAQTTANQTQVAKPTGWSTKAPESGSSNLKAQPTGNSGAVMLQPPPGTEIKTTGPTSVPTPGPIAFTLPGARPVPQPAGSAITLPSASPAPTTPVVQAPKATEPTKPAFELKPFAPATPALTTPMVSGVPRTSANVQTSAELVSPTSPPPNPLPLQFESKTSANVNTPGSATTSSNLPMKMPTTPTASLSQPSGAPKFEMPPRLASNCPPVNCPPVHCPPKNCPPKHGECVSSPGPMCTELVPERIRPQPRPTVVHEHTGPRHSFLSGLFSRRKTHETVAPPMVDAPLVMKPSQEMPVLTEKAPEKPRLPLGSRSVIDSGTEVNPLPTPIVRIPPVRPTPPTQPSAKPTPTPAANPSAVVSSDPNEANAFNGAVSPPKGTKKEAVAFNAFTSGGNEKAQPSSQPQANPYTGMPNPMLANMQNPYAGMPHPALLRQPGANPAQMMMLAQQRPGVYPPLPTYAMLPPGLMQGGMRPLPMLPLNGPGVPMQAMPNPGSVVAMSSPLPASPMMGMPGYPGQVPMMQVPAQPMAGYPGQLPMMQVPQMQIPQMQMPTSIPTIPNTQLVPLPIPQVVKGPGPESNIQATNAQLPTTTTSNSSPAGASPLANWTGNLPDAQQLPVRGSLSKTQLMTVLGEALYPSQREWAVDQLTALDWRSNPEVVEVLLKAAQTDPAGTVRASCVRGLARMNANIITVVTGLQKLKTDADPRVQNEVDRALAKLTASVPTVKKE